MSNSRRGKKNPPPIFEQIINVQMWFVIRYQFSHRDTFRGGSELKEEEEEKSRHTLRIVTTKMERNGTKWNETRRYRLLLVGYYIGGNPVTIRARERIYYILMYRYWCPAIDNSTRINHYFFFFFREKKLEKQRFKYRKGGDECIVSIRRLKAAATVALPTACPTNYS